VPGRSSVVRRVRVPADTAARSGLRRVDYADAFAAGLPPGSDADARAMLVAFLAAEPRWVGQLISARDRAVGVLGLKTSQPTPRGLTAADVRPGAVLGIFRVFEAGEREVLVGVDDRHLDFRVLFHTQASGGRVRLVVSTFVQFNNWLGRAYFAPVRLGHALIVPAMLRSAVRRLGASALKRTVSAGA
jgi:hypothetical protein